MPEGDSLHRIAHALAPRLYDTRVVSLRLPRAAIATDGIAGQRIVGVEARGKNLLIHFEAGLALHVHLKMHGRIRHGPVVPGKSSLGSWPPGCVLELIAERGWVAAFRAPVARLIRTRDLHRDLHFRHLGPDLLAPTCDLEEAVERLRVRARLPLGVGLMDQGAVAGIGNVWKSEVCFNQRLNPFAPVADYDDAVLQALLAHARVAMRQNVYSKPRSMPDPFSPPSWKRHARPNPRRGQGGLSVYRRSGEPCYDCGEAIARAYQGRPGRSTYFCPGCQAVPPGLSLSGS